MTDTNDTEINVAESAVAKSYTKLNENKRFIFGITHISI